MKTRILILEDDEPSSYLLRYLLTAEGFETRIATDGATGLRLAREHPPDLILLDYQLPDMNACELVKLLRGDPGTANIPIVISSAHAVIPGECLPILEAGVRAWLEKPIDPEKFAAQIRAVLGGDKDS